MADIVLKNRNGADVQYPGVDIIKVNTVDGGEQGFASFNDGELIPGNIANGVKFGGVTGTLEVPQTVEKSVSLDFSAGAMEVTPESGQVFSKVNIPVPETLTPGNIAEGVDIAGIIGTLAAGGGANVKFANGSFTTTSYTYGETITHDFGTIPDIIFVIRTANATTNSTVNLSFGFSKAFMNFIGSKYGVFTAHGTAYWIYTNNLNNNDNNQYINNVTNTTAYICGSDNAKLTSGTYKWFAISGLTEL